METRIVPLSEIKPNPQNPRVIKDDKFKKLVQSIKDFPEMREAREIVVNKDMVILGGNMRFRAMQEAKVPTTQVKIVDWSEEKQKEFIIKDNIESGEWDWEKLANEWEKDKLDDWGLDTPDDEGGYSQTIGDLTYTPSEKKPSINELVDNTKTENLLAEIDTLDIPEDDKYFLRLSAHRHLTFDYAKIADYYAHSDEKVKKVMEKHALVIIDYDDAIQNGYVELTKKLQELTKNEYGK